MSENSSEYLKRTCLICGCHTNQTINIYEPRSGPNIVQLIQAKFKFQPLNEDKYLCFSCNNWLINWHSLQALNSNDAESPSGTFRAHLNSGNVMRDEKSSGSKKPIAVCRPIAQIKPRQLCSDHENAPASVEATQEFNENNNKFINKINFNKRNFRWQLTKRAGAKIQHKSMQQCTCGKYMVVRSANNKLSAKSPTQTTTPIKCRKCRELLRLKACYLRSIVQVEKELAQRETPLLLAHNLQNQNLVIATETEIEIESDTTNDSKSVKEVQKQQPQQQAQLPPQLIRHQYLPKPTVDGKVVSMLRRLGTTLSREPQENGSENNTNTNRLPQIMSPPKPKSKWLRPLEDDEILLNFDSSISEVLPSKQDQFTHVNTLAARKCLMFQFNETSEVIDLCDDHNDDNDDDDDDDDDDVNESEEVQELTEIDMLEQENFAKALNLPKGLTITLI